MLHPYEHPDVPYSGVPRQRDARVKKTRPPQLLVHLSEVLLLEAAGDCGDPLAAQVPVVSGDSTALYTPYLVVMLQPLANVLHPGVLEIIFKLFFSAIRPVIRLVLLPRSYIIS